MKRWAVITATGVLMVAALLLRAQSAAGSREEIERYRNLGKAFYENPTTQIQAVEQFQKALALAPDSVREQVNYGLALFKGGKTEEGIAQLQKAQKTDPKVPHTWFNLGIAYKKDSKYEEAIQQFEQMIKLVPDEPISHYNLGVLYRFTGKQDQAIAEFETASKLNPNLAGPHFQLFNAYRAAQRTADAAREQSTFDELKKRQAGAAIPEDLEWSFFSEIYEIPEASAGGGFSAPGAVKFEARKIGAGFDKGLVVADVKGDGKPDLIAWSATSVRVFADGGAKPEPLGIGNLKGVISIAPGDFDNDGLVDLAVVSTTGVELYQNVKGAYKKVALTVPKGQYVQAIWLDYDHDYDPDLMLLGDKGVLLRNNGKTGFSDESKNFPFVQAKAAAGALIDVIRDTDNVDVAVAYEGRPGVVYRDRLGGKYQAQDVAIPAGARSITAFDQNHDGWTDLAVAVTEGILAVWNIEGTLKATVSLPGAIHVFADLENRGDADLVYAGGAYRETWAGRETKTEIPETLSAVALAAADFDADGKIDIALLGKDGSVMVLANQTPTSNGWMRPRLTGVKNPKIAYGAKVEVKAGTLYQKQTYVGVPLVFGMGARKDAETVRITWPNGMIQNQVQQAANQAPEYKEAPRLSGSCPMIFTWNGKSFEFLTDVLGVAPLGASSGDGYFPVDHDEYIQIPGDSLRAVDGKYEIRVTEELKEISYLDQIRLIAVDHPAQAEIFTNDKFKSPPFPEFKLFGVDHRVYPQMARDQQGNDVLAKLAKKDRAYADTFPRDYAGRAGLHTLDLDFGKAAPDGRVVLVLNGWVDWADGSTFLSQSQEKGGALVFPYLQVKDGAGNWKTVIEDMGIPSGKPKTMAVDLTGKFLSASREVRIVTSLCVYWDEIFLSENALAPEVTQTPLDPVDADLHFRGFSQPVIDEARLQPEAFLYDKVSIEAPWNPTAGNYTRYGDVRTLLTAADDRMIIMGSGDELRLLFPASVLPALKAGWKRDFLLLVDGWAKDADANTAFGRTVEPLPFHGMSAYPYPKGQRFPEDLAHQQYLKEFNTRPALQLLRPLMNLRRVQP